MNFQLFVAAQTLPHFKTLRFRAHRLVGPVSCCSGDSVTGRKKETATNFHQDKNERVFGRIQGHYDAPVDLCSGKSNGHNIMPRSFFPKLCDLSTANSYFNFVKEIIWTPLYLESAMARLGGLVKFTYQRRKEQATSRSLGRFVIG